MKVGVIQMNPSVGDFQKNAKTLVNAYRNSLDRGAEYVVGPRSGLSGYPIGGLWEKPRFVEQCRAVLEEVAKEIGNVPLFIGALDQGVDRAHGVVVLHQGRVITQGTCSRTHTYIWESQGNRIGLALGELSALSRTIEDCIYQELNSPEDLDAIISLTAETYTINTENQAISLLGSLATRLQLPIIQCNVVGGNDSIIFQGGSLAFSREGALLAQGKLFREDVLLVDTQGESIHWSCEDPMAQLYQALVLGVRDYVIKSGVREACVRLDGTINSAITVMIAQEALGKANVKAYFIDHGASQANQQARSQALAKKLEVAYEPLRLAEISSLMTSHVCSLAQTTLSVANQTDLHARIAALYLTQLSEAQGKILLASLDKSDLILGRCTLYGDMCGGLALLGDCPKTLVYELAHWINQECETIPYYRDVGHSVDVASEVECYPRENCPHQDEIIKMLTEDNLSADSVLQNTSYEEDVVRKIQREIDLNRWKTRQKPPVLKVRQQSFREKLDIPLGQRYQG